MSTTLGRRTALRSLAGVLAATLTLGVAACGSDEPSGPSAAAPRAPPAPGAAPRGPAPRAH